MRTLFLSLLFPLSLSVFSQSDRLSSLQSSRNLVITSSDGTSSYHTVTSTQSLMFYKQGDQLTLNGQQLPIADIRKMRLVIPQRFALSEDSATFTPIATDHALLAFKRSFVLNKWNTVVVPFGLSGRQVLDAFGEGTLLACYKGITEGDDAQVDFELLDLDSDETVMQPHTYYIIKPTREPDIPEGKKTTVAYGKSTIPGPAYIIGNVSMELGKDYVANTAVNSSEGNVRLRLSGTYKKLADKQRIFFSNGRSFYFMNDEGHFYEPTDSVEVRAFDSWLVSVRNTNNLPIRFFVNGIDEDITVPTSIESLHAPSAGSPFVLSSSSVLYDLQGRRVSVPSGSRVPSGSSVSSVSGSSSGSRVPSGSSVSSSSRVSSLRPGLYILNGKKILLK